MTAGRRDIPAVADAIDTYNGAYAERFAQAGLMVFAPDARAFGERREPVGQANDEDSFMRGRPAHRSITRPSRWVRR